VPFLRAQPIIPVDHLEEVLIGRRSPWSGTFIRSARMNLPALIERLLYDEAPLQSYVEEPGIDGEFSTEAIADSRGGSVQPLPP
jgi:hypothetical protein